MFLTTITTLILCQSDLEPTGSVVGIRNPTANPSDARFFTTETCAAGQKLRNHSGVYDWLGITDDGLLLGSAGDYPNAIPSHLRFTSCTGSLRKGGGITTDGRVYWWIWDNVSFKSGLTEERFVQIVQSSLQGNDYGHLLGLSEQGQLQYIGDESLISALPPVPEGYYTTITGSAQYPWYAAVSTQGTLHAWGDTSHGQGSLYDQINGQLVDWTSLCTFSGYELLGLRRDGTTESTSSYTLSGGPYIEIHAQPDGNGMFGIKADGTLCGASGGEYFTTYPGTFKSLSTGENSSFVSVLQTNDVNPVSANPSNLDEVYEQSEDIPNRLIQLEAGTYDFGSNTLDNYNQVRIQGTDKPNCIIRLQGESGASLLSVENCTVQLSGGFKTQNFYFENCDIQLLGVDANFQLESGNSGTAVAKNCTFSGPSATVVKKQYGSSHFLGCIFQDIQTILEGAGAIAVVDCVLPQNLDLGQNSLIELTSNYPYNTAGFVDFHETELTAIAGDRGPILRCDSPVTTDVWNVDVSNCGAIFGGAFWFNNADVEINRSQFLQNQAELEGNAIYAQNGSSVEIFDCSFVQNNSNPKWDGTGAIHAHYSVIDAVECLFSSNGEVPWYPVSSLIYSLNSYFCENDPVFDYPGIVDLGGNQVADNCDDFDCNANGSFDDEEIENGEAADCNFNGIPDDCDIENAFETDCNGNLIPDSCDLTDGSLSDCDSNNIPDVCTILETPTADSNQDGILDACQCITDINSDGFTDFTDLLQLLSCWGSNPEGVCNFADVSEDGAIDFADVLIMLNDFGPC